MKGPAKTAVAEAARLGYEYDRTNAKGILFYRLPGGAEVGISPHCDENTARQIIRAMQKACGALDRVKGRDATASKFRDRRRAALDLERLAAERRDIEAQHAAYLARIAGADLTRIHRDDLAALERRIDEIRELERLMTQPPVPADNRGPRTARHRS